jgi:hypothetical protein
MELKVKSEVVKRGQIVKDEGEIIVRCPHCNKLLVVEIPKPFILPPFPEPRPWKPDRIIWTSSSNGGDMYVRD